MPIPTPDLYNDAVQNPKLSFSDAELQAATADCNGFGIPKALGGGFAITYRLNSRSGKSYAVRCFHKEAKHLQERYSVIHTCLKGLNSSLFLPFEYQHSGIRIRGVGYPIVKMEWATGTTLGEYVEQNYRDSNRIKQLRQSFFRMQEELQELKIAHGDIQNGNILVSPEAHLRLIDYDGMFVPGMHSGDGAELGHKHFQHPGRTAADFTNSIDRFSFLVVDLSLWALTCRPNLFERFSTGENILFSANDFADPASSQVFQALKEIQDLSFRQAVSNFEAVCNSPLSATPRLSDFLQGRNIPVAPVSLPIVQPSSHKYIGALPVIDASSFVDVCRNVGNKVELVGKIAEVKSGDTRTEKRYVFINFGNWRKDCVRITVWSEGLNALGSTPDPSWVGQWIVVNGMIDPVYHGQNKYKNITYHSVGITLSDRSQLHKVTQEEARWRLGSGARPGAARATGPQSSITGNNEDVLKGLSGKSTPVVRPPTVPPKPSKPFLPPPQQPPVPASAQAKNEAILKTLQQSKTTGTSSTGGTSGPPNTSQTGCLVLLASMMALVVLFACIV